MIRISEIKLHLDEPESAVFKKAAKIMGVSRSAIRELTVTRKSIDSRKANDIVFSYTVDIVLDGGEQAVLKRSDRRISSVQPYVYTMPAVKRRSAYPPVVVGFGPAGMFAALTLARAGLCPIVLERGNDVDTRVEDVRRFFDERQLNENSNIQFGEGGAGTFSDGKLTTGIKNSLCKKVIGEFVSHGAPEQILYSATPHIGTDKLVEVVKNIRREIISLGGKVLFGAKLTDVIAYNGYVHAVSYTGKDGGADIETDAVILAVGHSARDTVSMLRLNGVHMEKKPFSVGARIEHPQQLINKIQYGSFYNHPKLPPAVYKLACHFEHERGAYTFCMCPGGTVVCASSEAGGVVTNGMSKFARDGENANSAILVNIYPDDLPQDSVLSGFDFQRGLEQAAFKLGGSDYSAPCQLVGDFLKDVSSKKLGSVRPSFTTGVTPGDIRRVLPKKVTDMIAYGIVQMDRKMNGFAMYDAVLTAPESRSSSPVRIVRDDVFQSNLRGLYPCGEGAGYAGGIVSAAVDGIRCAHAVLENEK